MAYASASSVTISGDRTAIYQTGTLLKLTQSATVKYFVVTSSSFGGGNTTVNVTAGTDFTVANSAISSPFYSYQTNPQGWPGLFNFTITWGGFSAAPTTTRSQFAVSGRICTVNIYINSAGTSNSTSLTISLPLITATDFYTDIALAEDATALGTTPGVVTAGAGNATATAYKNATLPSWGTSGAKYVQGEFSYPF